MEHSLLVWWAAVDSDFAQEPQWIAWADQQILRQDEPPIWILELAVAYTSVEARGVVGKAQSRLSVLLEARERTGDLWLGFLYLRFERNEIDLLTLLLAAGNRADCSDCGIDCETFYLMANELDGGGPTVPSDRPLRERTAELFAPMADAARQEWTHLWAGLEFPR